MATATIGGLTLVTSAADDDLIEIEVSATGLSRCITKKNFIGATITGGGTIATGGFGLTVPFTGTAALLGGTQIFTGAKTFQSASANNSAQFERTTPSTTGIFVAQQLLATSSGNMVDGFGPGVKMSIQDDGGVVNHIATIGARRAGADNSGDLVFSTLNAGVDTMQGILSKLGVFTALGGFQPSSLSDALSFYKVGQWTPDLRFGGANTGITYGTRTGEYVRIGPLMWLHLNIALTSKGSASGTANIAGLPVSGTTLSSNEVRFNGMATNYVRMLGYVSGGAINLRAMTAAGMSVDGTLTEANFNNTSSLELSVWCLT